MYLVWDNYPQHSVIFNRLMFNQSIKSLQFKERDHLAVRDNYLLCKLISSIRRNIITGDNGVKITVIEHSKDKHSG